MHFFQDAGPIIIHAFLTFCGIVALLALISPKAFAYVAELSGVCVTPPVAASFVDSPINIDQFVIKNSRQFGVLVLMVVGYLMLFFLGRVEASWTPPFLILVVGMAVLFAFSSFVHLGGEVAKIENQLAEARIDPLTGLANRRALDEELERRLSEKSRTGAVFSVAILDIDHFKGINDKHGHLAGDMVIAKCVADTIRQIKRAMDLAARYGGDEFVIIYPATQLSSARTAAEKIRSAIANTPLQLEDSDVSVTVSVGVAEAADGDDFRLLMERADESLYMAKEAGRNQVYAKSFDAATPLNEAETLVATGD